MRHADFFDVQDYLGDARSARDGELHRDTASDSDTKGGGALSPVGRGSWVRRGRKLLFATATSAAVAGALVGGLASPSAAGPNDWGLGETTAKSTGDGNGPKAETQNAGGDSDTGNDGSKTEERSASRDSDTGTEAPSPASTASRNSDSGEAPTRQESPDSVIAAQRATQSPASSRVAEAPAFENSDAEQKRPQGPDDVIAEMRRNESVEVAAGVARTRTSSESISDSGNESAQVGRADVHPGVVDAGSDAPIQLSAVDKPAAQPAPATGREDESSLVAEVGKELLGFVVSDVAAASSELPAPEPEGPNQPVKTVFSGGSSAVTIGDKTEFLAADGDSIGSTIENGTLTEYYDTAGKFTGTSFDQGVATHGYDELGRYSSSGVAIHDPVTGELRSIETTTFSDLANSKAGDKTNQLGELTATGSFAGLETDESFPPDSEQASWDGLGFDDPDAGAVAAETNLNSGGLGPAGAELASPELPDVELPDVELPEGKVAELAEVDDFTVFGIDDSEGRIVVDTWNDIPADSSAAIEVASAGIAEPMNDSMPDSSLSGIEAGSLNDVVGGDGTGDEGGASIEVAATEREDVSDVYEVVGKWGQPIDWEPPKLEETAQLAMLFPVAAPARAVVATHKSYKAYKAYRAAVEAIKNVDPVVVSTVGVATVAATVGPLDTMPGREIASPVGPDALVGGAGDELAESGDSHTGGNALDPTHLPAAPGGYLPGIETPGLNGFPVTDPTDSPTHMNNEKSDEAETETGSGNKKEDEPKTDIEAAPQQRTAAQRWVERLARLYSAEAPEDAGVWEGDIGEAVATLSKEEWSVRSRSEDPVEATIQAGRAARPASGPTVASKTRPIPLDDLEQKIEDTTAALQTSTSRLTLQIDSLTRQTEDLAANPVESSPLHGSTMVLREEVIPETVELVLDAQDQLRSLKGKLDEAKKTDPEYTALRAREADRELQNQTKLVVNQLGNLDPELGDAEYIAAQETLRQLQTDRNHALSQSVTAHVTAQKAKNNAAGVKQTVKLSSNTTTEALNGDVAAARQAMDEQRKALEASMGSLATEKEISGLKSTGNLTDSDSATSRRDAEIAKETEQAIVEQTDRFISAEAQYDTLQAQFYEAQGNRAQQLWAAAKAKTAAITRQVSQDLKGRVGGIFGFKGDDE